MAKKKRTFEQAIDRLAEIVDMLESGGAELEKSIELYKEGIELSVFCGESLKTAEEQVMVLKKTAENIFVEKPLEEVNAN